MNILAIDMGSYAVKYAFCSLDKKLLKLHSHGLVVIDDVRKDLAENVTLEEVQISIMQNFVEDYPNAKIITHIPVELITTRYLSLPVNNKKKADLMVPFQLDEDLPFSIEQSHFISYVRKMDTHCEAQVSISPLEGFKHLYETLSSKETLPHLMTSELAFVQAYAEQSSLSGSYAIIDIGHQYTKGYFVHNKNVISNHVSYIAGSLIDEVISETYEIPQSEAVTYKHQNCFLLTDDQYDSVNSDQKEFALLMKKIFTPLIQDLRRWELGFRVKYGRAVDRVFITGGTSNISNIINFLNVELGLTVEKFPAPQNLILNEKTFKPQENMLSASMIMLASQRAKNTPVNMLTGAFSGSSNINLPLHSTSFILVRSLIVLLVFISFVGAEKLFYLSSEEKKLDSLIQKVLKTNTSLNLTSSQRRMYKNKPERLLTILKKKTNTLEKEVETIKKALKINALKPLGKLHSYLSKNENIHMTLFESLNSKIRVVFESENADELDVLATVLRSLNFAKKEVKHSKGNKRLSFSYEENIK